MKHLKTWPGLRGRSLPVLDRRPGERRAPEEHRPGARRLGRCVRLEAGLRHPHQGRLPRQHGAGARDVVCATMSRRRSAFSISRTAPRCSSATAMAARSSPRPAFIRMSSASSTSLRMRPMSARTRRALGKKTPSVLAKTEGAIKVTPDKFTYLDPVRIPQAVRARSAARAGGVRSRVPRFWPRRRCSARR